ncbi:hypothetical protein [Oceanobacillus kimchii]|uniref:hypothetical protein n=1 Tax=Oceanobacillus kimchii TaxID=746691 RepID=UPI000348084D|nr:hypothetical protein [Oceanobacillus kimchii]
MKLNVSFKNRIKQLFCKHDRAVGISCCSQGINSKEGYWHVEYHCGYCGFAYGEWIKADRDEMEKLFGKETYEIK